MRKFILAALAAALSHIGHTQTQALPLLVTNIFGISSSWTGECAAGAIDNRSVVQRQNDYHSVFVTSGSGAWTVQINYSDVACTGPWTSFGSASQISQLSSPAIAFGIGNHSFIQIAITGNAVVTYAGSKNYFLSTATGSISFPITVGQGGTGITSGTSGGVLYFSGAGTLASSGAFTANLPLIGQGAGAAPATGTRTGNTTQFATWTGATTAARCVDTDASGNLQITSADCGAGALPAATGQDQLLRTSINSGNITTVSFFSNPVLNPADYNFPSQTPAGSLTASVAATVTLSPCPRGVVATDSNDLVGHRIHVGTVGTPEDVLITGGTCAGDGVNGGTVIFTPANNHANGYTVTSSTAGWNEAIRSLPKDAGNVNAYTGIVRANGASTISAAISVPTDGCAVRLDGGGFLVSSTSSTDDIIRTELPNFQNVNCGYRVDIENFILSATTSGASLRCNFCGGSGARNTYIANIQALGSPAICFWINGAGQGNGATFVNLQANGCTSEGIYNTISQVNMGAGLANVAQGGTFINPVIATASGAIDAFLVTAEASACASTCASGSVMSLIGPNLNGGQYGMRIQAIPNANLGEIYTTGGYFQGTTGGGLVCRASAGSGNSIADLIVTGGGYIYSTSGYGLYLDSKCSTVSVSNISGIYTGNATFPSVNFAGAHRAILSNTVIGGGSTNTGTAVAFTIDPNTATPSQDVMLTGNKIGYDPLYPSTYNVQAATGISIDANNHTQLSFIGNEIVGGTHGLNYVCTASCAEIEFRNNHEATRSGADVGWPLTSVTGATNSTASVTTTALATIPTPGRYRVSYYLTTGSVSDGTASATVTIGWTDAVGAKTKTTGSLAFAAGANQSGTFDFELASGNITYATTYSAGAGGNYNLTLMLEQIK